MAKKAKPTPKAKSGAKKVEVKAKKSIGKTGEKKAASGISKKVIPKQVLTKKAIPKKVIPKKEAAVSEKKIEKKSKAIQKPAKVSVNLPVAPEASPEVVAAPPMEILQSKPAKAPKVKKARKSNSVSAKERAAILISDEENARWVELHEKHKSVKPVVYDMKLQYEANKALQHKILGWGWILSNENDRLEVLFKDGRKVLISNYNR
jgi:hypothetical protein